MSVTLLQLERCPWCAAVRQALSNVGVDYEVVTVARAREQRDEVEEASGQRMVPVLIDGQTAVWDSRRIVRYLYSTYGGPERARSISELPDNVGGEREVPS
jgi:glutaredoxin 3